MIMKNYYEILEISPQATTEQIKSAVVQLGKKYAAKAQNNEIARNKFNEIQQAYKILSHPQRRKYHDEDLAKLKTQKQRADALRQSFMKYVAFDKQRLKNKLDQLTSTILVKPSLLSLSSTKQSKPLVSQKNTIVAEKATGNNEIEPASDIVVDIPKQITPPIQKATKAKQNKYGLFQGETLLFSSKPHLLSCFDLGAVILIILAGYSYSNIPAFLAGYMPTITLWTPQQISDSAIQVSLWDLGVGTMLLIGIAIQLEVLFNKLSTELSLTQKRIIIKTGLFSRQLTEIKLNAMESVSIRQSILGRIFNYGSVKIVGMGHGQTILRNISAPHQMNQLLWYHIEKDKQI